MDMTEQSTTEQQTPAKPKRKRVRKRTKAKAAAAVPKATGEFAGITVKECPAACFAKGTCIITGSACAHPHKGGLQASLATPAAQQRFAEAKRVLGKRVLDLTEK